MKYNCNLTIESVKT